MSFYDRPGARALDVREIVRMTLNLLEFRYGIEGLGSLEQPKTVDEIVERILRQKAAA